jgi:glyoxylase-like metal-dependent hydrolase (beta-lactamase superfamily II)
MKLPKIIRIAIAPFGMINCHLVVSEQGCILVDAGLPGSEHKIKRALKSQGLTSKDIKLIVITHAHVDHAGSAARVRELSGAPILAHEGDLDYYLQKKKMTFCSTGWFGRVFFRTGLILKPYEPFTPDILMHAGDVLDLGAYGFEGVAIPTPGHTAGSVSLQLASGDAMVGDLLASGILLGGIIRTSHAIRPPFEDDPHRVASELERMVEGGMQHFYMGHGGPLVAGEVHRHVQTLRTLKSNTEHQQCCQRH